MSKQFEVLQNGALKVVIGIPGIHSATDVRNELGVKSLAQQRKESTCIEMYKLLDGKGPQSLVDEFSYREVTRNLRICCTDH